MFVCICVFVGRELKEFGGCISLGRHEEEVAKSIGQWGFKPVSGETARCH